MKKFLFTVFILALLALLFRLGVSYELSKIDPQVHQPSIYSDMATYMKLAHKIKNGQFKQLFYYQPFYYSVFLPVSYTLFGYSAWGIIVLQSILGAFTVYLTAICASKLAGRKVGIIAGILILLSKILTFYTPYHLIATLQTFWVILIFYLSLISIERRKWPYWALCGFICGLAILTRGNIWFFIPGLLVAAFITSSKSSSKTATPTRQLLTRLFPPALLIICLILPQIPFSWHNTKMQGAFTGPSTAADAVLGLGNTPEAPAGGRNPGLGPGPMEYPPTYKLWNSNANGVSLKQRIWNWAISEPLAFLELTFRKLLLFWDHREIPNNVSMTGTKTSGDKSITLKIFGLIPTFVIITFAICGMLISASKIVKHRKYLLLFYYIVAYWLATSAFYILARFRAPLIPLLTIFAAIAFYKIYDILKQKKKRLFLRFYLPAIAFSIFICFLSYDTYRFYEPFIMTIARPNGTKVEFSPKKDMYLDNGPFTFGDWQSFPLKPGTVLTKTFANFAASDYKKLTVEIPLIWSKPGIAKLIVNGQEELVKCHRRGLQETSVTIPSTKDKIQIVFEQASVPVYLFFDFQRNYGRTKHNNQVLPAELVCRLYAEK